MKIRELGYFLSLIPIFLVIYGNLMGGWYTALNIAFSLIFLIIADWFFSENIKNNENSDSAFIPNSVLVSHVLLHTIAVFSLLYGIYSGIITSFFIITAVISTGVSSGMSGIIVAHELIHRKDKKWRMLGLWNLWTVNYLHWYVEHIRVHHRYVGISHKDSATAKYGESVYKFVLRTIPQQFISSFKEEARYLNKRNKHPILSNYILKISLISIFTWFVIGIFLGPIVMVAFLLQSLIAIILLEIVNYAEHYGLVRDENEKVNYTHSWQTDNKLSRYMLLELVRHPDHHFTANKEYQNLDSKEEAPVLPTGYWGSLPIVLIPPLWFKITHPRIKNMESAS